MLTIESAQNATYKKLLSLTTSKGLKKEGWFLLSGENLVREFLNESLQHDRHSRESGNPSASDSERMSLVPRRRAAMDSRFRGNDANENNLRICYELTTPKLKALTADAAKIVQLAPELFSDIDSVGAGYNILVLEQPPTIKLDAAALTHYQPQGIELVIPMGNPGNLGALIRS